MFAIKVGKSTIYPLYWDYDAACKQAEVIRETATMPVTVVPVEFAEQ